MISVTIVTNSNKILLMAIACRIPSSDNLSASGKVTIHNAKKKLQQF